MSENNATLRNNDVILEAEKQERRADARRLSRDSSD